MNAVDLQNAAVDKFVEFEGKRFLTRHFFFNDGDDRPVAEMRDGAAFFFDEAAAAERDRRLLENRQQVVLGTEMDFELRLFASLRSQGRKVLRQVETSYGRIDLLIDEEPVGIIEVKLWADVRSTAEALGQLFRYSLAYPGARLFVATPTKLPAATARALLRFGVIEWS